MKEEVLITKENYKDIFNSLTYEKSIYVKYDSEEVSILFNQMITVMNEFTGLWTVEEKKAVITKAVNGEWVEYTIDNVYQILYKSYGNVMAKIHDDNYEIENLAKKAKENSIICEINGFERVLTKYAKKIASKYNVKFTGFGFNGTMKAMSVKKQIEDAFLNGKYNISFPSDDFGVQTIRNHASTYGSLIGRKFRVELSKGFIVVHFKDLEEAENLLISAKELFNKIGLKIGDEERDLFFNKLLGNDKKAAVINEIEQDFSRKLYGKSVTEEEYVSAANWQRLGFASEYNWENSIKGDTDMNPDNEYDDF